MVVAEKYRVERRFQWMGQWYERDDPISRQTILSNRQVGESRLGSLQRNGFISLDPVTRPLDQLSKKELVEYGREVGADVKPNMVKTDLLSAIRSVL